MESLTFIKTVMAKICFRGVILLFCLVFCGKTFADSAKSISINFSGSRDDKVVSDTDLSGISGNALYGALPVAGVNWNNFQTHWSGHGSSVERSCNIKFCDGTIAEGVTAEWDSAYIYTIGTDSCPNNPFYSFIVYDHNRLQKLDLKIKGLTADNGFPETCTVYIYCSTDRTDAKLKFCPKTVNGTTYTYIDGVLAEGNNAWGKGAYALNNKLVEGGDYMKIENVPIVDGVVQITHAAAKEGTSAYYHGSIAAVQIDFGERSEYALSVNFSGGQIPETHCGALSGSDTYGAVPVAGDRWNNFYEREMENKTGLLWNDGAVHPGNVTFSHTCDNTWAQGKEVLSGNLFYGYLDDNKHSCTISGLTAANGFPGYCWVYIYLATDVGSRNFEPVTVNGVTYTYSENLVQEGSAAWGSSNNAKENKLVYGGDYLKVGPVLLEETGGRIDVSVVNLGNKSKYRGGIAAVQVAVPVSTMFTVTAMSEGEGTVAIGEGTPDATVSVDGTFGTPVETTLTATATAGYLFDHWEGPLGLLTSGTALDATISVRTSMSCQFKAVFLRDDVVASATWTGAGTVEDFSDARNWLCANSAGVIIDNGLPDAKTTIVIAGQTAFSFPKSASLTYHAIRFDNVQLTADVDWSGIDLRKVVPGGTIDLCGNDLEMTAFNGNLIESWTVTDSSTQGAGGKFILTVAEGDEFVNGKTSQNFGIALSGTLRFVKEGAGVYRACKAGQVYTGGTHIKLGTIICDIGTANAANRNPFGIGDRTQTIRIEKGAILDFNNNINGSIYNYELGGLIKICGANADAAWDVNFNDTWMQDIHLIDDATIETGWMHFGGSLENDYGELNLNGKTLTIEIKAENNIEYQCYVSFLRVNQSGTIKVKSASSVALQIFADKSDLSNANLCFEGDVFLFLAGNNNGSIPVNDFSYVRNYWGAHAHKARKVVVGGVYSVGANRPPMELKDGATLDLSAVADCWDATGHNGKIDKNNLRFNNAGQVAFASGATIKVNLGERKFKYGSTKVVNWSATPTATFKLNATKQKGLSLKVSADGLYVNAAPGLTIFVR
jgi:hypothetical protein